MRFAKLIDTKGRQISDPVAIEGSLSFDAKTGEAHAWDETGKIMLAELTGARVVWVGAKGIRIDGLEPIDLNKQTFRAQSWHFSF